MWAVDEERRMEGVDDPDLGMGVVPEKAGCRVGGNECYLHENADEERERHRLDGSPAGVGVGVPAEEERGVLYRYY